MAGFFQQFLIGAGDGFLGGYNLKDFKHGSKTFVTDAYANSPKFKWLFHVYFDFNDVGQNFPTTTNFGLLVKSIDLPKFNMSLSELNQYNRKRYVQTKIIYDPINISFHDDNINQVRHLWYSYYNYHYYDGQQPLDNTRQSITNIPTIRIASESDTVKLNTKNTYENNLLSNQGLWGYSGEASVSPGQNQDQNSSGVKKSFLRSIKIYGFNQHNFALYQLINPIIESFTHDQYNYYSSRDTMENRMSIRYESVKYYEGAINGNSPSQIVERFGERANYDTELSPINRPGSNTTILGQGGLLDAGEGFIRDVKNGNYIGAALTALTTARTYRNPRQLITAAKNDLNQGLNEVSQGLPGVIRAASDIYRNRLSFPALGAQGAQIPNATNAVNTNAQNISTRAINPISSRPPSP